MSSGNAMPPPALTEIPLGQERAFLSRQLSMPSQTSLFTEFWLFSALHQEFSPGSKADNYNDLNVSS
jgi:hypothetical protein